MRFNREQVKSLSSFFFDVAKGLVLGGVGFATFLPWNIMITAVFSSVVLAYICVNIGLNLLKEVE